MNRQKAKQAQRRRRSMSVRKRVRAQAGRPRLSIFRSVQHLYVQVIDDVAGRTLASASTLDKELRASGAKRTKSQEAAAVGEAIAQRAAAKGVKQVVLDRGFVRYHGRVKAFAEAARKAGLQF